MSLVLRFFGSLFFFGMVAVPLPAVERKSIQVEPVRSVDAAQANGKTYDLVVIGGTPGGIACAVRAAREGLSVLIVQHNGHIGGMLTNGLMQWDALYAGHRAPIFNEFAGLIGGYYLKTYGEDSPQYKTARFTQTHYPMSLFESSVAEHLFNKLVSAETNITTLLNHYPAAASRDKTLLTGLTLRRYGTGDDIQVTAKVFADATYEGDLAALAKVPYRVGREGRDEYGEPHAGKVFTNIRSEKGPKDAVEGKLNIHTYAHVQGTVDASSPFTADKSVQAYNYRFSLTTEEANRRLPDKPPGYNREEYVNYYRKGIGGGRLNGKGTFNNAILPGENHAYPDASWAEREKIIERHKNFALGLMYFLQNDESVSEAKRMGYRQSGLPLDEYLDNGNLPYEMYVREGRRIVGRYVFKEQDNGPAQHYPRTPVMADSVAITDWSMDSHDCTMDRRPGYEFDGKLILTEESRPAQIPWGSLLPQGVDNLIVPVCLSATHVAWGAVRLEPVFMQLGESAGFAAALAVKRNLAPAQLEAEVLIQTLVKNRMMISFLNDVDVGANDPQVVAAQYFGSKGFFSDYDALLGEPLSVALEIVWKDGFTSLQKGTLEPAVLAAAVHQASSQKSDPSGKTRGEFLLGLWGQIEQR